MSNMSWNGINTDAIVCGFANEIEDAWNKLYKVESLVNFFFEKNIAEFTGLTFTKDRMYHVISFELLIKFSGNDEIELNFGDDEIIYKCHHSVREDFEKFEMVKADIITKILSWSAQ